MANENVPSISSRLSRLDGVRTRLEDAIRNQTMAIVMLMYGVGGLNPPGVADQARIIEAFARLRLLKSEWSKLFERMTALIVRIPSYAEDPPQG